MTNIPVPDQFNFEDPESWEVWSKRFERYITVGGLNNKTEAEKIDVLLYVMGQKSESILLQIKDKPDTLKKTLDAFKRYFAPRTNVIFERFKFNTRKQNQGEPIDAFITDLHAMAEKCQFGELKDELIRDRVVVGMTDSRTSEAMQLKSDLTLQIAIEMARQSERQHAENKIIRNREVPINFMKSNRSKQHNQKQQKIHQQSTQAKDNSSKICYFCNNSYHIRDVCPAKDVECRKCGIKGHFQKACKSNSINNSKHSKETKRHNFNKVNNVNTTDCEDYSNDMFIGNMCCNSLEINEWTIECNIVEFNTKIKFLVDTGASNVSIPEHLVPLKYFKGMDTNSTACGPDGSALNVVGSIKLTISYNNAVGKCLVYVIKDLKTPLLGREAIDQLKIIQPPKKVPSVNHTEFADKQNSLDIARQYPSIFNEMGEFKGEVSIKLSENVKPYVQTVPRPVPIPMMSKLKSEIDRLLRLNIIEHMEEVTDWVSPIVVVPKNENEIRLCVDYTKLNEAVKRPYYPIPNIESTLANIRGASIFSKIDINKGFYQIKLDKTSQLLTCFITPFGRFIFTRLPFGISCAPEYFVSKYAKVLRGIENIATHIDDILIYGYTKEEHDKVLRNVLQRLSEEGITINKSKSVFGVRKVLWLGQVLSECGVSIDPDRIQAIKQFAVPGNKKQLLSFLGVVNFVGKFIPNKSTILEPLNALLKNDITFEWNAMHEKAFQQIKNMICEVPILAYYDPRKQIVISSDASSYGIGSCLIQVDKDDNREIVAYISRTMTQTERHYAQIEREALGLTWAAEKFADYITGLRIILETDHKPLIQILKSKNLDDLTPRLQRFRMRLMRYDYSVVYVPGKTLVVADALSRSPLHTNCESEELQLEVENFVNYVTSSLPIKDIYLEKIKHAQQQDTVCKLLKQFSVDGWPARSQINDEVLPYYQYRFDITFSQGILLKGTRIIIPPALQKEVIEFIHTGHQGITKCRRRAQLSVWWIGLSQQLDNLIKHCPNCVEERTNIKQPFHRDNLPTRPMQKIAIDLFKHKCWYIIITDYYSRYFEIYKTNALTEEEVISKLKQYFSR